MGHLISVYQFHHTIELKYSAKSVKMFFRPGLFLVWFFLAKVSSTTVGSSMTVGTFLPDPGNTNPFVSRTIEPYYMDDQYEDDIGGRSEDDIDDDDDIYDQYEDDIGGRSEDDDIEDDDDDDAI